MPVLTKINNPDVLFNVLQSTLDAVVQRLRDCELPVPGRRFVGFCEPPQDCCPDLVVWGDNIRPDDASLGQGLTRGYFTCQNSWSMDIHVRLGLCFVDVDSDSNPLPSAVLDGMSMEMLKYWHCIYMGFLCAAKGGAISEIGDCDNFSVTNSTCYASGGCAGFEYVLTVPLEN